MIMPVVPERMVGQKQKNYKFQPAGFNLLEDKFGLNAKMMSIITEYHSE